MTAEQERAAVVAWLFRMADEAEYREAEIALTKAAEEIGRGDHAGKADSSQNGERS